MKNILTDTPLFVGGDAGNAVSIGRQGNAGPQTHADTTTLYDVLYSNVQTGTAIVYDALSPLFRIACGGIIRGWMVNTEIHPSGLNNFLLINAVSNTAASLPGPSGLGLQTTTISDTPIAAGDEIMVEHTSSDVLWTYTTAVDSDGAAVCRIPVYDSPVSVGGGGGGRGTTEGPGGPDGGAMTTAETFVLSSQQVGGSTRAQRGGDGYYGGGSGCGAGGGGGSYVSRYISQVHSDLAEADTDSQIVITPLRYNRPAQPSMNVYIWLTRINMLRVSGGHGALMFTS
jgi:hypothetical protein